MINRLILAWIVTGMAASTPSFAQEVDHSEDCSQLQLYCIPLLPTARAGNASGEVRLLRPRSAFGVAVSREGTQRYVAEVVVRDLPSPASLGNYTTYTVWAMPPNFSAVEKLGEVRDGTVQLGEVTFNKFVILISAEPDTTVKERTGPLVLRGQSPSNRMQSHAAFQIASIGMSVGSDKPMSQVDGQHVHAGDEPSPWTMPPMHPAVGMMPGMAALQPSTPAWKPDGLVSDLPVAVSRSLVNLSDGDTLRIRAGLVQKSIAGRVFAMYAYNDQIPGPVLQVDQESTVIIEFQNDTAFPGSIHWHGLRQDNRFDGVPGVTQAAVAPGDSFTYKVHFPDAGIYWYHPHHREDIQQEMGLAGNMLVKSVTPGYFAAVDHEEILLLDDLLVADEGLVPFGKDVANYTTMGRFGNILLVNGEEAYAKHVREGDIVRFYFTNVSNTRTFNASISGHAMKVVATDIGRFEREVWEESVAIAPAERYVVEVQFAAPGAYPLINHVQGIDHQLGRFFAEVDTLGMIFVDEREESIRAATDFQLLRERREAVDEIDRFRPFFDRPIDRDIELTLEADALPAVIEQIMRLDRIYFNPVEWSGTMPMMNWATTSHEVKWILRDLKTGKENTDIEWRSRINAVEKVRFHNRADAAHAMQHPIHLHGQRFLVLSYNGQPLENRAWKDTVLIPAGMSAEILVDYTNPGKWMLHCHIAEHLEGGMKLVFEVDK